MRSAVFVSGILKTPAAGYAFTIKADYIEVTFRNDLDKRAVIQCDSDPVIQVRCCLFYKEILYSGI